MREAENHGDRDGDDELVRLMVAYQSGELAAFEGLYGRLAAELRRYFQATGWDGSAQDLVQETFLAIHRSRRTYQPGLPVRPWAFGIARNILGRHRREAWRRSRTEDRDARPSVQVAAPAAAPALEPRDLAAALARLPASRREAWVLHHVHGLSFQQIAARFRIGVGAAKLRSSRAMRALRAALGVETGGAPDG
jgi:RNA polymerase sigma-70 factor (ECF subfamily)